MEMVIHELRHHKRLPVAENTADGDIPIPPPCRYELCDSISDSYSCAENSGPESEERLEDLSSPLKITATFSVKCVCFKEHQ